MILLSERLKAIASMVPRCKTVADIGCDHAYVAIYLVENHITEKVIACDVNKGPLRKAAENAKAHNLEDCIELRLSDGLAGINQNEADVIVIAGMGGPLMQRIISEGIDKISDKAKLVLQPQSDIGTFRRFLSDSGFMILSEKMIFEDGKYYPMMLVTKGQMDWSKDIYYEYGRCLIEEKNMVLMSYLEHEKDNLTVILEGFNSINITERSKNRKEEIVSRLSLNEEAMRCINEV